MHGGHPEWKGQPNYAVLVDTRDRPAPQITYVPQENIEVGGATKEVDAFFTIFIAIPAGEVDNDQAPVGGRPLRELRRVAVPAPAVAQDRLPQRLNREKQSCQKSLLSPGMALLDFTRCLQCYWTCIVFL